MLRRQVWYGARSPFNRIHVSSQNHRPTRGTAAAGNSTERLDACQDYQLPAEYEPYLNTSFLGERQFVQVETVNFSYFTFGPLQEPSEPGEHTWPAPSRTVSHCEVK